MRRSRPTTRSSGAIRQDSCTVRRRPSASASKDWRALTKGRQCPLAPPAATTALNSARCPSADRGVTVIHGTCPEPMGGHCGKWFGAFRRGDANSAGRYAGKPPAVVGRRRVTQKRDGLSVPRGSGRDERRTVERTSVPSNRRNLVNPRRSKIMYGDSEAFGLRLVPDCRLWVGRSSPGKIPGPEE